MIRLMTTSPRRETLRRGKGLGRLVLAGVGAFLVASGLLLRFYAAPRLIAAPADLYQTDTLVATDASYFDQGSLTTRHGVTLTYTLTIRGDPGASTSTTAVWDSFAALADLQARRAGEQHLSARRLQPPHRAAARLLRRGGQRRHQGPPARHRAVLADRRPQGHLSGLRRQRRIGLAGDLQRYG